MAHEWHAGVMSAKHGASWHRLEKLVDMRDACDLYREAIAANAWPAVASLVPLVTREGLEAPGYGVRCDYESASSQVVAVVGERYRVTTRDEWRSLCEAVCDAGALPTGGFSLFGGSRLIATFQLPDRSDGRGLKQNLVLADDLAGRKEICMGDSHTRVVCANTMQAAFRSDGSGFATIRHTLSAEQKIERLVRSIPIAIAKGERFRAEYEKAVATTLPKVDLGAVLGELFPDLDTPYDVKKDPFRSLRDKKLLPERENRDGPVSKTRATIARNLRHDAQGALRNRVNWEGPNLATAWNVATFCVDRDGSGQARPTRAGSHPAQSMLFGSRAERLEEIQTIIQVFLRDGTLAEVTASQAVEMGVEARQVGRAVLQDLVGGSYD